MSDEVVNDYQKYNEVSLEIDAFNKQLEKLLEEWEELSS